ncbi:DUF5611 family protein [Candidatus Methanocrinis natronophilus]|uniref:DUF5611 family protein n=1 Tax=Candidatus Methanocrinis natronophilus TaxID=3033396 RepID=A0ABT5XAI0_9EURY|nr:DUF5611 family protein [Candidatus Methanocrinis natronophilus]MDF0591724.1 DUF5611 family protein [Candidatus Methanocrinis natronophilus]
MEYSFKRGYSPELGRIRSALEEEFPTEVREEGGRLLLSYGALKVIEVSVEGKKLVVKTESSEDVADEVVLDTNKRYRNFLEKATGYTAKQRLQQAKKEVGKS